MEEHVAVVCGRRIERRAASALLELCRQYQTVIVDLGTGDGRWLYRVARARPEVLCVGIDSNVDAMREVSSRAARKPARGGLPNVRFVAAAVESLPAGLLEIADEVWVAYPWGSLLQATVAPDPLVMRGVAAMLKPHGVLRVSINESILGQGALIRKIGLVARPFTQVFDALRAGYGEAGLNVTTWRRDAATIRSSWAGRLGQGTGVPTLSVEAVKDGDGSNHGGR
jgi:16S rRNA (adenine(1408)-N(1))-methyltransferase